MLFSKQKLLTPSPARSLILSAIGAVIGLAIAGFSLFTAKGTISHLLPPEFVAMVNQRPILRSDFIDQAEIELQKPFKETTRAERLGILDKMIDEELLVQRGDEIDLAATDGDVRVALLNGVNLQVDADVLAEKPTDAQLRGYFDQHRNEYAPSGQMRLRDLTLDLTSGSQGSDSVTTKARQTLAALRSGATIAHVMSQFGLKDSSLVARDVDIFDYGVKAQLGPELYTDAARLASGEISDPIIQGDKLHIIIMEKRTVGSGPASFPQVADKVWVDYLAARKMLVERNNLHYLRDKADIRVSPEYSK